MGGGVEAWRGWGVGECGSAGEGHEESLAEHGGPGGVGWGFSSGEDVAKPEAGASACVA